MEGGAREQRFTRGEFEISTDKARLDIPMIHEFLSTKSYWAAGIPLEVVQRSIANSLCFGLYHQGKQIGFGKVITDYATTAYVGDIFVLDGYRGQGLGQWMIETIVRCPSLEGLRLWFLGTKDAHGLYEKVGFRKVAGSSFMDRLMAILDPDVYKRN